MEDILIETLVCQPQLSILHFSKQFIYLNRIRP